jgi:hypothetical protein
MRLLIIGCFAFTACVSRLDESALSRGPSAAGDLGSGDVAPGSDLAGAPAQDGPPTLVPAGCQPFAMSEAGQRPAAWNEARGTWRVAISDGEAWLRQESTSQSQGADYIAWTGDSSWRDQRISARIKPSGIYSDDCVLVRYQAPSYYYALCLDLRDDASNWELVRRNDQSKPSVLASGALTDPTRLVHELSLRATGSMLFATVDGEAKPAVTDTTLPQGAAGLSTEENGRFATVCAEPR